MERVGFEESLQLGTIGCVADALKVFFYFYFSNNKIDGSKEDFNFTVFTRLC